MKLKKQQMIIVGVILIALILVVSVAVIMMSNNGDNKSNNNNDNSNGTSNGDGTNRNDDGTGNGDGDGDNGDSSQPTGNWVDLSSNIPGDANTIGFTDVYAIGDKVWITTNNRANIYYSGNGETSFSTQSTGTNYACTIFMKGETEGYAGTADGRVLGTTDGSTWNVLGGTLLNPIHSISFPLTGDGYCCGNNGWVGTVNSSGITSTQQIVGGGTTLFSINFPTTSSEGWVCGASGIFFLYTGSSWDFVSLASGSLSSAYFVPNTTEGWVVGDGGLIGHSSNGTSFGSQT
ncbi:MAG: hypothetical protein DRN95_08465, partial [Candidatus Hydrothermarchaeota archaeon]